MYSYPMYSYILSVLNIMVMAHTCAFLAVVKNYAGIYTACMHAYINYVAS